MDYPPPPPPLTLTTVNDFPGKQTYKLDRVLHLVRNDANFRTRVLYYSLIKVYSQYSISSMTFKSYSPTATIL